MKITQMCVSKQYTVCEYSENFFVNFLLCMDNNIHQKLFSYGFGSILQWVNDGRIFFWFLLLFPIHYVWEGLSSLKKNDNNIINILNYCYMFNIVMLF